MTSARIITSLEHLTDHPAKHSPYFQAGFGLMVSKPHTYHPTPYSHFLRARTNAQGVGVGITVLRRGAVLASVALRRRLLVTLEINNKDRAYDWFLAWLAHHQRTTRRPTWAHSHQLSVETAYAQHKNGSADVLFRLVAGPGVHWLKYRGAWMQVRIVPPTPFFFLLLRGERGRSKTYTDMCMYYFFFLYVR